MQANPNEPTRKAENLLRLPAVETLTGLKRSSIYFFVKGGSFPKPLRLSARAVAWRESDIAQWQATRMQAVPGDGVK